VLNRNPSRWILFWLLSAGLGFWWAAVAATPASERRLVLPSENLANAIWVLEDPNGKLTLEDVLKPEIQARFTPWGADRGDVNLSFSDSVWWFRLRLQREAGAPVNWILDVPYAYNRLIDFHAPGKPVVQTGHGRPVENRPLLSPHFAFPVALSEQPQDFHFRVASRYAVSFPLNAWHEAAYARHALYGRLLQALYHGALLAMILHAIFIALTLRDARFGLYAIYGSMLSMGMLTGNGWGAILLWPNQPAFDEVSSGVFFSLALASLLVFTRQVLKTRETMPRFGDRLILGIAAIAAAQAGLMTLSAGSERWAALFFQGLMLLSMVTVALVTAAVWRVRSHEIPGKHVFMLSWSVMSVGVVVASVRVFGWLPSTPLTLYAVQIATSIEMLLLSFMLAIIVRTERRERLAAQRQLIDALTKQEQRLEQTVQSRTRELADVAERERRTLSEYLRFAALVSHEFRNGLNVISAQSEVLQKSAADPVVGSRTAVIRSHVERLAGLTDAWLKSDQIFNTPEGPAIESIDCRTWIEAVVAKRPDGFDGHAIGWKIADDATTIWADPNLLEIVLMNLLSNACKYSPPNSGVDIQTCAQVGRDGTRMTGLRVTDRGIGIEPSMQARVFDRYVRAKPEGPVSGIGLGLSLVHHIVDQHRGQIELQSEPGHGSTFTVWLPDRDRPARP
jgi:signal transduction histidine kinase